MPKLNPETEQLIARHGWMAQFVFPTSKEDGPSFTYTVGLADEGLPELIVFAVPANVSHRMIVALIEKLRAEKAGGAPALGQLDIDFTFPVYMRDVSLDDVEGYATAAIRRSDGKARFRQISITDKNGKFRWNSEFSGDPLMYPILGPAPTLN